MAAILQFANRERLARPALEDGHTAKILIYTGVRFERIDFEKLKQGTSTDHQTPIDEFTRIAN